MQRLPKFDSKRSWIIVTMGLPCTWKSVLAKKISDWVDCPMLFINDFIEGGDNDAGAAAGEWEEEERLRADELQRSFTTLCRVANRLCKLERRSAVVVKSRLCSAFELEQLMKVVGRWCSVLIVECRVRNKHLWHRLFNDHHYSRKWYRPTSWIDMEKAIGDHFDPRARADWDLRLLGLKKSYPYTLFRRLVVDPLYDLHLATEFCDLNPVFCHAMTHLVSAELNFQKLHVMEFDEFRRSRAEQILKALPSSSARSTVTCGAQGCVFRYWEEVPGEEAGSCCGVCGEAVVPGEEAYTCYYCIFPLHKSCAEMVNFDFRSLCDSNPLGPGYFFQSEQIFRCKACADEGRPASDRFCESCAFETILKGRLAPLVVNHEHHPGHPLPLRIRPT